MVRACIGGMGALWLAIVSSALSGEEPAVVAPPASELQTISAEAYEILEYFYRYEANIPLEARTVEVSKIEDGTRRKIVYRGARGHLVPAYLELPTQGQGPFPIVLLMHGWSGGKENWWQNENYIYGGKMRRALLAAGYAVFAIDAQGHGDRIAENDYQVVNIHHEPGEPQRENYFTLRDVIVQTVLDTRRGIDYLQTRADVDTKRLGALGYSMGGFEAFALTAMEPRIRVAVGCVVPVAWRPDRVLDPTSYTRGFGKSPFLMLMGKEDGLCNAAQAQELYRLIQSPQTDLQLFDCGHRLPESYVSPALGWFQKHL